MGDYYTPPKMVPMRVVDCLFDISESASSYEFVGYTPNPEDPSGEELEYTIFSGDYFISNLFTLYYNRLIMVDEDNPEASLLETFYNWRYTRQEFYGKMAHDLATIYEPFNYVETMTDDITEHVKGSGNERTFLNSDTHTITYPTKETTELTPFTKETNELTPFTRETNELTPFTKETDELTPFTKETHETTPYTNETTTTETPAPNGTAAANTHSMKAFNDNAFVDVEKDTRSGSEIETLKKTGTEKVDITYQGTQKNEKYFTGTQKNEKYFQGTQKNEKYFTGTQKTEKYYTGNKVDSLAHNGKITDEKNGTDTDTRNYTLTKRGGKDYGDVLSREYDNLRMNLANRALAEFFDQFTFYSEGVDI